jgi:hypothetical protein
MHQAHAKTAQNKAGSSLCGKKDGFCIQDPLDKIFRRFLADILHQTAVFFQNTVEGFPKGNRFAFFGNFGCQMLFQNSTLT